MLNQLSRTHSSALGLVARYGVAAATLGVATLVRWSIDGALGDHLPYVTYFVAVAFAAWSCGLGPSILTLLAGAWVADFLFISPRHVWYPHLDTAQRAVAVATYFMVGISTIAVCEAIRRAARRDIAQRKAGEQALRQTADALRRQKDQFTTLVEHIPDIVARLDRDLRFLYISPSVLAVTGKPQEHYLGQRRTNAGIPEPYARQRDELSRKVFQTGQEYAMEFPIETAAGERRFEIRMIPELAPDGSVESLMTLTRDITQRKRAEEALRDADRRKDEFLATLAHELRGPLAPLTNMLQIIKRTDCDHEQLQQARDVMERQLHHMRRLVDDLLDVSRISLGKIELRRQRVELRPVVHTAVETCRPLAEAMDQQLIIEIPREPILLDADPVRLAQVLSNLLNNACKFSPAGGQIRLTAARDADELAIRVSDSGIGIPSDKLESIFDLFAQVNTSLERPHSGLGIGLTLVKQLIEMHGGTVSAHSPGPGRGSEFVVRLPVAVSAPEPPREPPPAPTQAQRIDTILRRILVVDDNRDAASSLARLLKLDGHEVHLAHDGIEAVQAAQQVNPDLILLDIGLPRLNGYDACRQIRAHLGDRPLTVIALTGWGQEQDRQKSRDAGFDAHFVKPIDYPRLTQLLNTLPLPQPATSHP